MIDPMSIPSRFGDLLRGWRVRRHLSQLELAGEAGISTRHLSFIETGRAQPSREMILRLSGHLELPLREQNILLTSAGFAPVFEQRPLDDPALEGYRGMIETVLAAHEPYPALAVDRHWNLVAHNRVVGRFLALLGPAQTQPPVNVLRLTLHPEGLAPRVLNLLEWRAHLLERLRRQARTSADPVLNALFNELSAYPVGAHALNGPHHHDSTSSVVVPFRLSTANRTLSFFSTTMVFGTPVDITLSELAIEFFFPADPQTVEYMHSLARST